MKTLLTGGAGYIGTHTAIELLQHGHDVVIFDNFQTATSKPFAVSKPLRGSTFPQYKVMYEINTRSQMH